MDGVLKFPSSDSASEDWAEEICTFFKQCGKDCKIAIVTQTPEGDVMSGYWNCQPSDKVALLSHSFIDVIHDTIKATYEVEPL
jgi:hypothetical protein